MVLFLRSTALVSTISGLLVFVSIAIGQMTDTVIVRVDLKVDEITYILHIEDRNRDLRIRLAGTRCYPEPPDWIEPEAAPWPYYDQYFIEPVISLGRSLTPCR